MATDKLRLRVPVTIKLRGDSLRLAQDWLNTKWFGGPEIPLDDPIDDELVGAHYRINASKIVDVDVEISVDGSIELS